MNKPTESEARKAIRVLIRWAGDDPDRKELIDTPTRVIESYKEFFSGYGKDSEKTLSNNLPNEDKFDDMIILKNVKFTSFCEHHILPMCGFINIAYIPDNKIAGIGNIAKIVDVFSKRLQIQERLTMQITNALEQHLRPKGIAISIAAQHQCLNIRGTCKDTTKMQTTSMTGLFKNNLNLQNKFLSQITE